LLQVAIYSTFNTTRQWAKVSNLQKTERRAQHTVIMEILKLKKT